MQENVMEDERSPLAQMIREAYRRGEEDETLSPLVLTDSWGRPVGRIDRRDAVIFYNIRGEREIELTRCLTEADFREFPVVEDLNLDLATMIEKTYRMLVRGEGTPCRNAGIP
jgi:2,3-bisphosphoglycerate-independent phosphoglycerate mutase